MLYKIAWLIIGLETGLLLSWIYSAFYFKNGTDAAGRGFAIIYILALAIYIVSGIILLIIRNKYCTGTVIIMAALPLLYLVIGLLKKYF